jgi:hypothetical protein
VKLFFEERCSDASIEDFSDVLVVTAPVRCVESFFSVRLVHWRHQSTGALGLPAAQWRHFDLTAACECVPLCYSACRLHGDSHCSVPGAAHSGHDP